MLRSITRPNLSLMASYRHPVIKGELEKWLKDYIVDYFKKQELNLIALETMPEHVHILFEAVPNINLSTFVNAFKTASSRMVRKNFAEELAHYYWKPYFWSLSYFIGSVSDRSTEVVKRYIEDQKGQ